MTLYKDVVRRLLRTTEGYECQEAEGNFMLVFHKPMKAVQFCLLVSPAPLLKKEEKRLRQFCSGVVYGEGGGGNVQDTAPMLPCYLLNWQHMCQCL